MGVVCINETTDENGGNLGGNENVLKLIVVIVTQHCDYTEDHQNLIQDG